MRYGRISPMFRVRVLGIHIHALPWTHYLIGTRSLGARARLHHGYMEAAEATAGARHKAACRYVRMSDAHMHADS